MPMITNEQIENIETAIEAGGNPNELLNSIFYNNLLGELDDDEGIAKIIEILLDKGADLNDKDADEGQPKPPILLMALMSELHQTANLLIDRGATLDDTVDFIQLIQKETCIFIDMLNLQLEIFTPYTLHHGKCLDEQTDASLEANCRKELDALASSVSYEDFPLMAKNLIQEKYPQLYPEDYLPTRHSASPFDVNTINEYRARSQEIIRTKYPEINADNFYYNWVIVQPFENKQFLDGIKAQLEEYKSILNKVEKIPEIIEPHLNKTLRFR